MGEKLKKGRAESTPKKPRLSKEARDWFANKGRIGGQAKVTKGFGSRTPEERSANAKAAARARWGTKKKKGARNA